MNKKWNWNNPITWKQSILGSVICLVIYAIGVLIWLGYFKDWAIKFYTSIIKRIVDKINNKIIRKE